MSCTAIKPVFCGEARVGSPKLLDLFPEPNYVKRKHAHNDYHLIRIENKKHNTINTLFFKQIIKTQTKNNCSIFQYALFLVISIFFFIVYPSIFYYPIIFF